MSVKPTTVLMVDDNADDRLLLKLACGAGNVCFELRDVENGDGAIAYLEQARTDAHGQEHPIPDAVLLDLKMPGRSGFDVLNWIRRQRDYSELPVIVLTSSIHSEDRARALELGATEFVVKPVGYDQLQSLVSKLDQWLHRKEPLKLFVQGPEYGL